MFLILYFTDLLSGVDDVNNNASSLKEALNDPIREKSYKDHLKNVLRSIK
jgi:beta-glucosidase